MGKSLNEKDESLCDAMNVLLHEIKNPITALMFQSEALKTELPKEYLSKIETMDREINRLAELTKEASTYVQNPEGKPEQLDLLSTIKNIAGSMPFDVTLNFNGLSSLNVEFDKDRARSIFENLIKNAGESNNGKNAEVCVECARQKDLAIVQIMDRGVGLPSETRDKIFDYGFTTKPHGSGVGLFLAKRFVEAKNGSLKLYPREGGGTVSEVILKTQGA